MRVTLSALSALIIGAFSLCAYAEAQKLVYGALPLRADDAPDRAAPRLAPGSHLKVYLPSQPYLYISHAINGALTRPANTPRGWDYDLATEHSQIDEITYEFKLRQGVVFQDGKTPFNADAVVLNMRYFKRKPPLYSKIHEVLDKVQKIDEYTVQFSLREKYGTFLNDLVWMQFYSPDYLLEYGWNGKPTPPNLAAPGPYGLGPYILQAGYAEGDRQTDQLELVANPYYWDKRYPKIERVTVYTELPVEEAKDAVLHEEGKIDLAPIDFAYKIETILSPYAKLVISPSTNAYAIHINMRTGHPRLQDKAVRLALNQALHQRNLLHFTYDYEGELSATLASAMLPGIKEVQDKIKPYSELADPYAPTQQTQLKDILNGLSLSVLTPERFLFLWRGIEYQLAKVGVALNIQVLSEKDLFAQLMMTNLEQNSRAWDLLSWDNDDWFLFHPWSSFMVYRSYSYWSTLLPDGVMDAYLNDLFRSAVGDNDYHEAVQHITQHAYENAYMLFVPTPHKVFAVNKEVIFTPYPQAVLPLWEIGLSDQHVSLRTGDYPEALKHPVEIIRKNFNNN